MIYAELATDQAIIGKRIFGSMAEFLSFREQGWMGTKEVNAEADELLATAAWWDKYHLREQEATARQRERLATINRLCNLAPDDDGEVFEPYTDTELAAMNARMARENEK